jgi:hypothetical protein
LGFAAFVVALPGFELSLAAGLFCVGSDLRILPALGHDLAALLPEVRAGHFRVRKASAVLLSSHAMRTKMESVDEIKLLPANEAGDHKESVADYTLQCKPAKNPYNVARFDTYWKVKFAITRPSPSTL